MKIFCFPITKGLIKAYEDEKISRRSTEYTYLVLNRCTCGGCINKDIDLRGIDDET